MGPGPTRPITSSIPSSTRLRPCWIDVAVQSKVGLVSAAQMATPWRPAPHNLNDGLRIDTRGPGFRTLGTTRARTDPVSADWRRKRPTTWPCSRRITNPCPNRCSRNITNQPSNMGGSSAAERLAFRLVLHWSPHMSLVISIWFQCAIRRSLSYRHDAPSHSLPSYKIHCRRESRFSQRSGVSESTGHSPIALIYHYYNSPSTSDSHSGPISWVLYHIFSFIGCPGIRRRKILQCHQNSISPSTMRNSSTSK